MKKNLLMIGSGLFMAVTLLATALCPTITKAEEVSSDTSTEESAKEFDPSGSYHAAIGIQTCTTKWLNRQAYYDAGLNKYYETEQNNILWAGDPSASGEEYEANFNDIEITGNGTYTISVDNASFADETAISQLYIATDIPVTDAIKVTDYTVNINGRDIVTFPEADLETEAKYTAGGMIILAINHWRPELVANLESLGVYEDASNGINLLNGFGSESITMTFTISGFDYDNPNALVATAEEVIEETLEEAVAAIADETDTATVSNEDESAADITAEEAEDTTETTAVNTDNASNTTETSSSPILPVPVIILICVAGLGIIAGIIIIILKNKKK